MSTIDTGLKKAIIESFQKAFDLKIKEQDVVIEIPKEISHGDYSSNVAMRFCKLVQQAPREVAKKIKDSFPYEEGNVETIEIAGPGFLNFTMKKNSLTKIITKIKEMSDDYGKNNIGSNEKVNCEYVSANPTGSLHIGHARGAAWADSVTRLMKMSGYDVTREYYVNDAGNQIHNLALSLYARYCEQFGVKKEIPNDGYVGEDIIAIAKQLCDEIKDSKIEETEENIQFFREKGIYYQLERLKQDLRTFRVEFDVFVSEQAIRDAGKVEAAIKRLRDLKMTYEEDGAIWFASTKFGDDKDRVLKKSDGSYTYLVPDIAYHMDKLDRGFDKLVNFFGADHHGYVPRLKASIEAMGKNSNTLEVDIIQMVRIVENGEEIKMSKRLGNAITLKELCDEVGVDAARYFMVQRALDTHFDFDLGLAKSQSNDNPVYYAQYAHARMCSILSASEIEGEAGDYNLLTHEKEIQLLKYLNEYTNVISDAAKNRAPNKVCNYIQKLASLFHSFYGACKVNDKENEALSLQRLDLLKACKITLKNALNIIGVEAIEKM
ncbi:MAG: arginine--tRNA ligase [Breznakia sp.]